MYQEGKRNLQVSGLFKLKRQNIAKLQLPKLHAPQQTIEIRSASLRNLNNADLNSSPKRFQFQNYASSPCLSLNNMKNSRDHDSLPKLFSSKSEASTDTIDNLGSLSQDLSNLSSRLASQVSIDSSPKRLFQSVIRESKAATSPSKRFLLQGADVQHQENNYNLSKVKLKSFLNNISDFNASLETDSAIIDKDSPFFRKKWTINASPKRMLLPDISISSTREEFERTSAEIFPGLSSARGLKPILKKQESRYALTKAGTNSKQNLSVMSINETIIFLMPNEDKRVKFMSIP